MSTGVFVAMAALAAWSALLFALSARSGGSNELTAVFQGDRGGATDGLMALLFAIFAGFASFGVVLALGVVADRD
jgi:hypothetical protein